MYKSWQTEAREKIVKMCLCDFLPFPADPKGHLETIRIPSKKQVANFEEIIIIFYLIVINLKLLNCSKNNCNTWLHLSDWVSCILVS